jgi:hypothetical protein
MADDPVTEAAIERLEEYRQRLIQEKVARNEAVLRSEGPIIVTGSPCKKKLQELKARQQRDEHGREIFYDDNNPRIIVTGVPRAPFPCPECDGSCAVKRGEPPLPGAAYQRELEKRKHEPAPPLRREPTPVPALPPAPTEWWPFRVQIRAGNGGDDPGQIIEGRYGVTEQTVYVEDDQGKPWFRAAPAVSFQANGSAGLPAPRDSPGTTFLSASRRFALASAVSCAPPVRLPPGCARLATKPVFSGSIAFGCTIGIVVVAFLTARVQNEERVGTLLRDGELGVTLQSHEVQDAVTLQQRKEIVDFATLGL